MSKLPDIGLHSRSTLAEIEIAVKDFYKSRNHYFDYVKDLHFEWFVFNDIKSFEEAKEFSKQLTLDRNDTNGLPCQKTYQIDEWLSHAFWQEQDRYKRVLAVSRRICCSCHETGSYAKNSFSRGKLL